ncbi:hypothetical protein OUZ56_032128 [Daphnia magna]|uniref:MADF domain-containing protein n=1 Tax=Daphnia magna TaxID=35525 RepID=A0ABQ9ZW79_9CRUS|nr:hypothetical protein OUZ56_032128 [Daphnia magna]
MEIESSILLDNSALKECWNSGKRASQLNIDMEATELLLNLLKEKWSLLIDNKTNQKQIWNDIATGLSEQGFLVQYPAQKSEHRFNFLKPPIGGKEGRRGDGHIGQGWRAACAQLCRYRWHMCRASDCDAVDQCLIPDKELLNISNHNNSSPHLESNTDLQHHIQKGYTYVIDNDVNIYRQLEHKLNCFGKQHYQT